MMGQGNRVLSAKDFQQVILLPASLQAFALKGFQPDHVYVSVPCDNRMLAFSNQSPDKEPERKEGHHED